MVSPETCGRAGPDLFRGSLFRFLVFLGSLHLCYRCNSADVHESAMEKRLESSRLRTLDILAFDIVPLGRRLDETGTRPRVEYP